MRTVILALLLLPALALAEEPDYVVMSRADYEKAHPAPPAPDHLGISYSAAICVYRERARDASDVTVSQRFAGTTISRVVRAADSRRYNDELAGKLRRAAAKERVKVRSCGDKAVRALVRCLENYQDACEGLDEDEQTTASDLLEGASER